MLLFFIALGVWMAMQFPVLNRLAHPCPFTTHAAAAAALQGDLVTGGEIVWQLTWPQILTAETAHFNISASAAPNGVIVHRKYRGEDDVMVYDLRCRPGSNQARELCAAILAARNTYYLEPLREARGYRCGARAPGRVQPLLMMSAAAAVCSTSGLPARHSHACLYGYNAIDAPRQHHASAMPAMPCSSHAHCLTYALPHTPQGAARHRGGAAAGAADA